MRMVEKRRGSYGLGHGTTISLNAESSYDWVADQWTMPINLAVSQVFKIGEQAMSFQVGGKYYAEAPESGPDWGTVREFAGDARDRIRLGKGRLSAGSRARSRSASRSPTTKSASWGPKATS